MNFRRLAVLACLLIACSGPITHSAAEWQSNVEVYGAVGALAELSGEVTILAGKTYLSFPEGKTGRTETPPHISVGATLLVTASVAEWSEAIIQQDIAFAELDEKIAEFAATAGFGPQQRLPFLIEGKVQDLQYHMIDGSKLKNGGTSHRDHLAASIQVRAGTPDATLIGFYSDHDQTIFTHLGATTHVHCVTKAPLATGYVDHVMIPAGSTIRFPLK
ncbi:MAG: hypothetical protein HQ519_12610 [Planctomycetes bacterium]|nr:hypothetical protein [Planctomycetota bacterium]